MDLTKTIEELRRERKRLERIIASLEEYQLQFVLYHDLQASLAAYIPVGSRRGRKSMSPEERREVSARMKKYWAGRLANRGSSGENRSW